MINLMPYDLKKQTAAARFNLILFRYVIILCISIGFLIVATSITYLFLSNEKTDAENQQLKINTSSNPTQKQANTFRANLNISKSIIDRQISYAKVLNEFTKVLPSGTVLDSLTINDSSFNNVLKLKVLSTSSDNESRLKQNFEGSSQFSSYKFESTTSNQGDESAYPFIINVSITLNKVSV